VVARQLRSRAAIELENLALRHQLHWAHAMAPGADLKLFIGDTTRNVMFLDNFADAVNDNTCGVISMSFAQCGLTKSQVFGIY